MSSALEEMYGKKAEEKRKEEEKKRIEEQKLLEEKRTQLQQNVSKSVEQKKIEAEQKKSDKDKIINELIEIVLGYKNIDPYIIKMAQWLDFKDYCHYEDSSKDENTYSFKAGPFFCEYKGQNIGDPIKHKDISWKSRLEQCYTKEFFYVDVADLFLKYGLDLNCTQCPYQDHSPKKIILPHCPYVIAVTIQKLSDMNNYSKDEIYKLLLGDLYKEFCTAQAIEINAELLKDFESIDLKSALSAYILIQADLLKINSSTFPVIKYITPILCKRNRDNLTGNIIEFWKSQKCKARSFDYRELSDFYKYKRNCRNCDYRYCPDKVAAVFTAFAIQNGYRAIDVAYYVARHSTGKLSLRNYFSFDELYSSVLRKYAFSPESVDIYQKIIKCIINHGSNNKIHVSLNMVIHTSDIQIANEIVECIFCSACYVYDYFDNNRESSVQYIDGIKDTLGDTITSLETSKRGSIFYIINIEKWKEDCNFNTKFMHFCKLAEERKNIPIVIAGEKESIQSFFAPYSKMYYQTCQHHLDISDMESKPLFNNIIESLEEDFEISHETEDAIYNYISDISEENELRNYDFIEWFVEKLKFDHYSSDFNVSNVLEPSEIPKLNNRRSVDEVIEELFSMVGLHSVKNKIAEMNAILTFNQKSQKQNKECMNLHMAFLGNAGTGKTTVAKLMAEILYNLGYIRRNKLICCSAKDLEGAYLGQSSKNTAAKCESAYGGILFIDEAYQLNPTINGQHDRYKQDVVDELIQQMENNRDKLVVILAGYPREMEDFITNANSGFESRIPNRIFFEDYTIDELMQIFKNMVSKNGLILSTEAALVVKNVITEEKINNVERFSNARFVRNIFEKSFSTHAKNVYHMDESDPEFYTLSSDDITR